MIYEGQLVISYIIVSGNQYNDKEEDKRDREKTTLKTDQRWTEFETKTRKRDRRNCNVCHSVTFTELGIREIVRSCNECQ